MIDIARAQKLLDELKRGYIAELPSKFDELELLVLNVKGSDDFDEALGELFRKVHSLKGSSGTHGLHELSSVCHRLEDYLRTIDARVASFETADANKWIEFIDLMRKVLDAYNAGDVSSCDVAAELESIANRHTAANYSVLIVDQSKSNAMLYQSVLSSLPVNFTLMTDGYHALELLLGNRYDLLVTSMEVKRLNGMALVGAVKLANGVSKDIKTVVLTSNTNIVMQGQNTDPDKLITKCASMTRQLFDAANQLLKLN